MRNMFRRTRTERPYPRVVMPLMESSVSSVESKEANFMVVGGIFCLVWEWVEGSVLANVIGIFELALLCQSHVAVLGGLWVYG